MKKKKSLILPSIMLPLLMATSCGSDTNVPNEPSSEGMAVSFTLSMPVNEKINYTRAEVHDASEYAINSLSLYEYEVGDDNSEKLVRVLKTNGMGKNSLDLGAKEASNGYTFSIIVPNKNVGKSYTYRFVANDLVDDPEIESAFSEFQGTNASLVLSEEASADALSENGIAMTGVATVGGSEVIEMTEGLECEVKMTRIVSRIDLKYQTPNLKVTSVELRNAPVGGKLFPQTSIPVVELADCLILGRNINSPLPSDFLNKKGKEIEELKKLFYLDERENTSANSAVVHIEYEVDANDKEDYYHGSIDVDFSKADGTYINSERNHLYTIVLGNGKDPVSGQLKATVVVEDWVSVEIEEALTTNDKLIE